MIVILLMLTSPEINDRAAEDRASETLARHSYHPVGARLGQKKMEPSCLTGLALIEKLEEGSETGFEAKHRRLVERLHSRVKETQALGRDADIARREWSDREGSSSFSTTVMHRSADRCGPDSSTTVSADGESIFQPLGEDSRLTTFSEAPSVSSMGGGDGSLSWFVEDDQDLEES